MKTITLTLVVTALFLSGCASKKQITAQGKENIPSLSAEEAQDTHWVRKTSATLANQITGDFYAVSRLMDHSSPNITLRYVTPTNLEKRKVADALNSVLDQNAQGKARGENPDLREKEKGTVAAVPLCSGSRRLVVGGVASNASHHK